MPLFRNLQYLPKNEKRSKFKYFGIKKEQLSYSFFFKENRDTLNPEAGEYDQIDAPVKS